MTARQNFCRCPNSEHAQINPWLSRLRSARLVDWLALCQRHKSIGVSGSVSSKIFAVIGPAIIPIGTGAFSSWARSSFKHSRSILPGPFDMATF